MSASVMVGRRAVLRYSGLVGMAAVMGPVGALGEGVRVAKTSGGRVSGALVDGVKVFKGIAYGADTRGTRFMAPKKVAAWAGVKACTEWPHRAPQQQGAERGQRAVEDGHYHLPADQGVQSEDCLYLNVWTRGLRDGKKRPVVFYIHGGAYNNGTVNADLYDGRRLCQRGDVVVVTVNHRLNAFGYMELASLPGLAERYKDSGNVGMLDLVLALEWVRDNIAEFGGDAGRVTIFGQSGGGAKCATLMAMESAKGLFHRVLTMSGQQVWAAPMALATERAKVALKAMGLDPAKPGQVTAEALDGLTMEQIQAGARTTGSWLPVKDGWVLARDPFDPDAPGMSAKIPMILGNTKDEIMGGTAWRQAGLTWETLPAELGKAIAEFRGPYPVEEIVAAYRRWYPGYKPVDVFVAAMAAFRSWPGQVIEAERRASDPVSAKRTWVYQMDFPSPTADGRAPHTEDLAFVFDNLRLSPGMVGASEAEIATAQPLATRMSGMLIEFARTGAVDWPVYGLKDRETMMFDRVSKVGSDPRGDERRMMVGAKYRQPGT
ncbi:carboxylesterase/lipase family protein [Granulicella tundricola]|uniref:Carboxylic ester hydrolase n=1 Tax=Granulicella tundricola (strain ATCC BAA-1859 / DSM 23138 / MP5ACTX9) TaxID=1198114 RepID=E8X4H7_GRATM|nr:carboxylesterase family protein [Granulicella tundricola]ADW68304.1 Carboxylesterase type B [Granulicella tundricola MP5ACTX9]